MSAKTVVRDAIRRHRVVHDALSFLYSSLHRARRRVSDARNRIDVQPGSWLDRLPMSVAGDDRVIRIGRECRVIHSSIRILGSRNTVVIEDGVFLERGELVLEDDGNTVHIGRGATLCRGFHVAATEGTTLSVGPDALVSSEVQIRNGDSRAIFEGATRINQARDVSVGRHVWVGNGAKILKGARVADDSVVATGAIVTGSFDVQGSVLAGAPASCVRTGVRWEGDRHASPREAES